MAKQGGLGAGAFVALPLILVGSIVAGILLIFGPAQEAGACAPGRSVALENVPPGPIEGYSGEQLTNAAHIMNAATALGMDRSAQIIGVMTAMGESSLRVLDYGDDAGPDSRGLFQQRDNGAWGSYSDRMDPTISATNFFSALQRVPNWMSLPPTLAAHKVQGNADPFYYEDFYAPATTVVGTLAGGGEVVCQGGNLVFPLDAGFQMTDDYGPRPVPIQGASDWHAGVDLQNWPGACGKPVYAITSGTVTYKAGYQLSIKSPDGYTVDYLHMKLSDITVSIGDSVTPAQQVGRVGNEGPSTGCHLHLAIETAGNTNPAIAALRPSQTIGGPAGFVNPEEFYEAFGIVLCPPDTCARTY
jgi:murein DD-endopeptidase MepM/ murein hydrolase activator NlpD